MTMTFIEPDKVTAIAAVERNIAAEQAMADQHAREAVKLRTELEGSLDQLSDTSHRELIDKIASADRAAERTKARAAAMSQRPRCSASR